MAGSNAGASFTVTLYGDSYAEASDVATAVRRVLLAIHDAGDMRGCDLTLSDVLPRPRQLDPNTPRRHVP